jgi:hypothetical protein
MAAARVIDNSPRSRPGFAADDGKKLPPEIGKSSPKS